MADCAHVDFYRTDTALICSHCGRSAPLSEVDPPPRNYVERRVETDPDGNEHVVEVDTGIVDPSTITHEVHKVAAAWLDAHDA